MTEPPSASSNSTVIAGAGPFDSCNAQRGWFHFRIYDLPDSQIQPQFRPYVHKVDEDWLLKEEDRDNNIDYLARFYEAKKKDRSGVTCEPTLVYRGTDSKEFDFAFEVFISINNETRLHTAFPTPLEKIPSGWTKKVLISETGSFNLPVTTDIPFYESSSVPYAVSLTLKYPGDEAKGWATNVKQALGLSTNQYKNAKKFARKIASYVIANYHPPVLSVTGHSLGGGLAAAAISVIAHEFSAIKLRGVTFNASGLYSNTVAPDPIHHGGVYNLCVEQELLTTLQSHVGMMPLFGSLLNLARFKLPEGVGARPEKWPISPGRVWAQIAGLEGDNVRNYPGEGARLPCIFAISDQTYISGQKFPRLTAVDAEIRRAATAKEMLENLAAYMNKTFGDAATSALGADPNIPSEAFHPTAYNEARWKKIGDFASDAFAKELKDLGKLLSGPAADYHRWDVAMQSFFGVFYPSSE